MDENEPELLKDELRARFAKLPGYSILNQANFLRDLELFDNHDIASLVNHPGYIKLIFIIELTYATKCLELPLIKSREKRERELLKLEAWVDILEWLKDRPVGLKDQIKQQLIDLYYKKQEEGEL